MRPAPKPFLPALLLLCASGVLPLTISASQHGSRESPGKLLASDQWSGHLFHGYGIWQPASNPTYSLLTAGGRLAWSPAFGGFHALVSIGAALLPGLQNAGPGSLAGVFGFDELWLRSGWDLFSWSASVQAGIFRWRPNPDALLRGGYLARWGAYPDVVVRPGHSWESLDSLSTMVMGMRLTAHSPGRGFSHEVLTLLDTLGGGTDFSFAYAFNMAPHPALTLGAVVELYGQATPMRGRGGRSLIIRPRIDTLVPITDNAWTPPLDTLYFSQRGTLFSGQAALDLARLFTGETRRDRGGRIFAEAALLGWRNYPVYFPSRWQRVRMIGGADFPAFGWLDRLRLQAERALEVQENRSAFGTSRVESPPGFSWTLQVFLSRRLTGWLDAQGWAQREFGGEDGEGVGFFQGSRRNGSYLEGRLVFRL